MTADAAHVAAVDLLHQGLIDHRLGSATEPPWYLRKPRPTRMPKDYVQTYRCKCGQWEGAHADHQRHVAETLTPLIRAQVAAEIRAMRTVCPAHGYPDCSPLLNGCSFPLRWIEREDAARIAEGAS